MTDRPLIAASLALLRSFGVSGDIPPGSETERAWEAAMGAAMEAGPKVWRCFQCDEVFTDEACARLHFGEYQDCDPICKVGAERYRDLENQLAAYRSESDEATKEFYALGARHTTRLMREEEKGYERGLADGQALAAEYGPAALSRVEAENGRLRPLIETMLHAIDNGGIDSQEQGEPEVGIPIHKWHEEWAFYARATLSPPETPK